MSYLYVTEQGSIIGINGGTFTVKYKDGMLKTIPMETLESISIFGNSQLTSQCIRECLKRGIPINYFSNNGSYYGKFSSTRHTNVKRLKKQIFLSENKDFSLQLSKKIIDAKVNNQIVLLRRYSNNSEECIYFLHEMKKIKEKINSCKSIEQLMGYEGIAAKNYFKGLSLIIKDDFKFNGRNRRPPKDKFNSLLSLGYTILMNEIYGEIESHGLNPYVGFMHADSENHPTLASDLMEEWRAVIVDAVVMSLIQGNEIHTEHFFTGDEDEGIYLNKEGMKIFINKFENKLRSDNKYLSYIDYRVSFRRAFALQNAQLVKCIEEENVDEYKPVYIR